MEYFASVSIDSTATVYVCINVYACIQNLDNLMHTKYGKKQIFFLLILLFLLSTFHCVDSNTVDNNAVINIMCTHTFHMYMLSHILNCTCGVCAYTHTLHIYVCVHILYLCVCIHTVYVCIYTHIWHVYVCHKA